MPSITLRQVRKAYGSHPVVRRIDLEIAAGSFVVVVGPSGCGKSTLLRMIAGLEEVSGGEILIDGRVVNRIEPAGRGCAMVFQNYALYPHMTVGENIGYALKVAGRPRAERRARVEETAALLGLADLLDRKPGQLSGGQRQRVAIGRAMIRRPGIFLFDEPLSNVDASLRGQMRSEIRRLHRHLGTTSIMVTHDQGEAMALADRIVVMKDGGIEQTGAPLEIYRRPATRFVAEFIGSPPMTMLTAWPADGRLCLEPPEDGKPGIALGIRPEAVRLDDPPAGDGRPLGRVEEVEELGASRLLRLAVAGQVLTATTTRPARVGQHFVLGVDAADIHHFSPDGHRLEDIGTYSLTLI